MSDSLVKNSGTADSLLKDTVLSGLRELAADSAGHLPDSVRGKVAIPDSIGAAVTDSLQADSVAEDTAKVFRYNKARSGCKRRAKLERSWPGSSVG